MIGEVGTYVMMSGGGGSLPSSRYMQARYLEIGGEAYGHEVVVPGCQRQGSKRCFLGSPWGWSSEVVNGKTQPVRNIEFDALRFCQANPLTKRAADPNELRALLRVMRQAGIRTGIYLGNALAPAMARVQPWIKMVQTVAMPFADLVDDFVIDAGAGYTEGDRFDQARAYIENRSDAKVMGEPRHLVGTASARHQLDVLCQASYWQETGDVDGNREHVPFNDIPTGSKVYLIDTGNSIDTHAVWLAKGLNILLGLWSGQTSQRLKTMAGTLT